MRTDANVSGKHALESTEGVPDQRRDGEDMTTFTMRRLRNEVIEQCAHAAEKAWPLGNYPFASENSSIYRGQDHVARTIVKAIRGLKT